MATILHAKGDRNPSLTDTIKVDGVAFDLSSSTVKFQMREETTASLKVDTAAVIVSAPAGTVRYDWAAIDVDTEADYLGWWLVTTGGKTQRSPEFSIAMVDYTTVPLSTRALVGLRETKDWLAERRIDTGNDEKITQAINAASEEIMRVSGRELKPNATNPEARTFALGWNGCKVDIGDLKTATTASSTISVYNLQSETLLYTLVATDYVAIPRNRKPWQPVTGIELKSNVRGYNSTSNYLSVNGHWGFPSVPENIRHATMDAVAFWLDRDVEHFRQDLGIGNVGEAGQTVFVGQPPTVFSLPPESFNIAVKYRRRLVYG